MTNQFHLYDLHCHTPFSDGQRDFDTLIEALVDIGIQIVGFADHVNPFSMYHNPKRFKDQRRFVITYSARLLRYRKKYFEYLDRKYPRITILNGAEIDIYPHGGASLPRGISPAFFDYLMLVKHHTLPPFPGPWKEHMWEKGLYAAFARYEPDVFGHPQEGMPRGLSREKIKRMMLMARQHGVALELNHVKKKFKNVNDFLDLGHELGIEFSLGSDFHGFQDDIKKQLLHSQEMHELAEAHDLKLLDPRKFIQKRNNGRS